MERKKKVAWREVGRVNTYDDFTLVCLFFFGGPPISGGSSILGGVPF